MPRTYLIDAHNALHRLGVSVPKDADAARRLLVSRARESLRSRGDAGRVLLVFDTTDAGRLRAGTNSSEGSVAWSYATGSADDEILRIVRENDARDGAARLVVVTDDREVRGRAAQLGAGTVSVREWFGSGGADGGGASERRDLSAGGPPMSAADFGLPGGAIDLDGTDPEDV
jgi:predicted RNA-binding protein with PIN domain